MKILQAFIASYVLAKEKNDVNTMLYYTNLFKREYNIDITNDKVLESLVKTSN